MTGACWYLDPYPVFSHAAFRNAYVGASACDWRVETMPAEGWRWRLRAAGAAFAERLRDRVRPGDVIMTTSMLDVSQLKGLLPGIAVLQYMHENQAGYGRAGRHGDEAALRQMHSAMAADRLVFNSRFHRDDCRRAFAEALRRIEPASRTPAALRAVDEAAVIYPCVAEPGAVAGREGLPLLLWNHRWCAEKDPAGLLRILRGLRDAGCVFRLAVVGSPNERPPAAFATIAEEFASAIVAWGTQSRGAYEALLAQAAVVLSTAREENFGLAVAEAAVAGAIPVLPRRLVYPELYDACPEVRWFDNHRGAIDALVAVLREPESGMQVRREALARWIAARFDPRDCARRLDVEIAALVKKANLVNG